MAKYYVNRNAQNNGDHEVHMEGCSYMPLQENCSYLGEFTSCQGAVAKAKRDFYEKSDGCKFCCNACHTS